MKRILGLLGLFSLLVACAVTIESESSKTVGVTVDENTQVEEKKPLFDFTEEEKPLDLSNDIDGEDLNRLQQHLKDLEQPFAFGPSKVVISPEEEMEHVYFVIENPSEEAMQFRLFNDCGDANLRVGFEAKVWVEGSEQAFKWLLISSNDDVAGSFDCSLKVYACADARRCVDFAEESYTVVVAIQDSHN